MTSYAGGLEAVGGRGADKVRSAIRRMVLFAEGARTFFSLRVRAWTDPLLEVLITWSVCGALESFLAEGV